MAGKHRKPTNTAKNLRRAAVTTVGGAAAFTMTAGPLGPLTSAHAQPVGQPVAAGLGVVLDDPSPSPAAQADIYIVVAGDWLSAIAPRIGVPDWHTLYDQNRDVIGADPNMILPGQQLEYVATMSSLPPVPSPTSSTAPVSSAGCAFPAPGARLTQGYTAGGHNGIDLAAPIGTKVFAAASGTVTVAGPRDPGGFGQAVYIDGDDGNVYWYGHIETWTVEVGQHVIAGQQIATVGERGNATGPHLHFEVHTGPGSINPTTWLMDHGCGVG